MIREGPAEVTPSAQSVTEVPTTSPPDSCPERVSSSFTKSSDEPTPEPPQNCANQHSFVVTSSYQAPVATRSRLAFRVAKASAAKHRATDVAGGGRKPPGIRVVPCARHHEHLKSPSNSANDIDLLMVAMVTVLPMSFSIINVGIPQSMVKQERNSILQPLKTKRSTDEHTSRALENFLDTDEVCVSDVATVVAGCFCSLKGHQITLFFLTPLIA